MSTHASTLCSKARAAATRAANYLRSRQSPDGGFCFYRWGGVEESSLLDTWHALAAFGLAGADAPRRDRIAGFLWEHGVAGLDDRYHRALALRALGEDRASIAAAVEHDLGIDVAPGLADPRLPATGRLEYALRTVVLQRLFGTVVAPEAVAGGVNALRSDGGWGAKPNLGDTWLALAILTACDAHEFADGTREFIDGLQVASFGFAATRDSAYANLDIVHAGIRACAVLNFPLRHADDAIGFVLACQTDEGGFARAPDALPNIGLTHRGLLALATAGALPAPEGETACGDAGW